MEDVLANQIPDYDAQQNVSGVVSDMKETPVQNEPNKISSNILNKNKFNHEKQAEFEKIAFGDSINENNIFRRAEIRDGWMPIDKKLLGGREKFYPEDWEFYVRAATVEAIRNWSILDEKNTNSIDEAFNEMLKHCLMIKSATGIKSWQTINLWDKFFFILLIREYTFIQGESKVEFTEYCSNCEHNITFKLNSQSLMYDLPDDEVMKYFDRENRMWVIDPADFDVQSDQPVVFYIPTLEKDANIKAWAIAEYQENEKRKFDNVFIKFLLWLCPKISKDLNIARTQIRKSEMIFKSWNTEMFSFMDEVLKNIIVTPSTNISTICPECGEEATARLRFPDGIGSLFTVVNRRKKFGSK